MPETYLDQLTLELRRRDVPGDRIGEVLAEVETHVAESGDPAADTFGPPGEYAASVAAALRSAPATAGEPRWRRYARLYAVGIGAFLLAHSIIVAVGFSQPGTTLGTFLAAALLPLSAIVVVTRLMRPPTGRRLVSGLIVTAAVAAPVVAAALPLYQNVPGIPWQSSFLVSLALLSVGLYGVKADRVIDPRDGHNRYPLPRRAAALLIGIPLAALAMAVLVGLLLA